MSIRDPFIVFDPKNLPNWVTIAWLILYVPTFIYCLFIKKEALFEAFIHAFYYSMLPFIWCISFIFLGPFFLLGKIYIKLKK